MAHRPPATRVLNRLRRIARASRYALKRALGKPIRIHIENRWRLGDEIMAIPFYALLRARYPDAKVTVSVNYPGLLTGMPGISVDVDRSEFDCDLYVFGRHDARSEPRLKTLCAAGGISYEAVEPSLPAIADRPRPHTGGSRSVACSCGAGWPCKSWSVAYLRRLAAMLRADSPGVTFVEVGRGCAPAGIGENLIDALPIEETARVLSECDLYIGPDSGLVHLAMAVGTPAVGLYGPVIPDVAFGPRAILRAIRSPAACQGCWTEERMKTPGVCPLGIEGADPEAYPCMRALTPEVVHARIAANGLLGGRP